MKRIHSILMAVVVLIVSSCATKSDIETLQGQINELKTGKIATIEQQISAIQASITSLQATDTQLSTFVSTLQLETSNIKADLSANEKALSDRIDNLRQYTDEELGKTKDWASATFATLEQYQAVLNDLAEIKESIKALDKDLRKEIEDSIMASEESMKGWVNEQLAGYYTIAQMDAKLKALADADAANEQAIGKVASDLGSAKTELTEAYTKAIGDAITKYNGEITAKIAADIKTATDALQKQIDALDDRVTALERMIQSVTLVSNNSDGSFKIDASRCLTLNCMIRPITAAKGLTKDNFKLYTTNVLTKASSYSVMNVNSAVIDEATGEVIITTDMRSLLNTIDADGSISVAINVKSGINNYTTSFVNVTDGMCIDLGLSVKWASYNLGATKPEEFGGYYQWAGTQDVSDTSIYLDINNCPYHTASGWTKYNEEDWIYTLEPCDDVANITLGKCWHIPDDYQWSELIDSCTWTWTTFNGVNGYKLQSKIKGYTDRWIFLPVAGYRDAQTLVKPGILGFYWTASIFNRESPAGMVLTSEMVDFSYRYSYSYNRHYGLSVRPVYY